MGFTFLSGARASLSIGLLAWTAAWTAAGAEVDGDEEITRLCPEAMPSCRKSGGGNCLRRVADALPSDLLEELRTTIAQQLQDSNGIASRWVGRGASPQNVFQRAAVAVASALNLQGKDFASVEYWVKSSLPEHNMHFDSQESWEDCAAFPFVSTILYLDDRGPPTMMTSKSLADLPFADPNTGPDNDTIFLSWPERNHLLQFSGDLYHGIHMHQGIVRPKDRSLRAIALFNFWPHVHPDTAVDVQDPIWEQQVGKSADVPVHVHELPPAKKSDKDRWTAEGEEFFGEELILKLKYRVPGGRSSIHGCKLDEATWVRTCADGSVNSTLIAVPHGIEQMSMSGESKFEGGIWGRGLGDDSDDDDDHDEF